MLEEEYGNMRKYQNPCLEIIIVDLREFLVSRSIDEKYNYNNSRKQCWNHEKIKIVWDTLYIFPSTWPPLLKGKINKRGFDEHLRCPKIMAQPPHE